MLHWKECEDKKISQFPYRGEMHDVTGTSVRWFSKSGDAGHGYPEYGLRFFTIQPGGEIPIHNHFYHQTMFILSGEFECWEFDSETDGLKGKATCGPGSSIYIPSMQPHGMRNVSGSAGTFLCCICNVYDAEEIVQLIIDRLPNDRDDEHVSAVNKIADHRGAIGKSNRRSLPGRVRYVLGSVAL